MAARQLRLFPHHKPLLERFGADFFRTIPMAPGVYIMRGEGGRILYIGQSKNLRHRLATYKNAHPEDTPRKIIRMIHQVESIAWESCATPEEAIARETTLLRRHRPKFNVQNTWPVTWFYFGMRSSVESLHLRLTALAQPRPGEQLHGAYPGRMMGRRSFRALTRLLWASLHRPVSPYDFPLRFSQRLEQWDLRWSPSVPRSFIEALPSQAGSFLQGESLELVDRLEELLLPQGIDLENPTPLQAILQSDVERLRDFFLRGPAALFEMKQLSPGPVSYGRAEAPASDEPVSPVLFLWDRPREPAGQGEFSWDIGG